MKRRHFLATLLATAGSVAVVPAHAASLTKRRIWVYDPALPAIMPLVEAARATGDDVRAVEGDRIRFARDMVGGGTASVAGVTRYADFLMLSGVAAEAGYRVVSQALWPGSSGAAISWTLQRRR